MFSPIIIGMAKIGIIMENVGCWVLGVKENSRNKKRNKKHRE